jgi:hypothetical protein
MSETADRYEEAPDSGDGHHRHRHPQWERELFSTPDGRLPWEQAATVFDEDVGGNIEVSGPPDPPSLTVSHTLGELALHTS